MQGLRIAAVRTDAGFGVRRIKVVISKEVWPNDIAVGRDGRERGNVWIAELRGKLYRFDAATGDLELIGELKTADPTNIEHGLYSIEIDPAFYDGSPCVYMYYAQPHTFTSTSAVSLKIGLVRRPS